MAVSIGKPEQALGLFEKALKANPLFNTERYTRNLELGFEMAYDFHWQGKGPEHIIVTDKTSQN